MIKKISFILGYILTIIYPLEKAYADYSLPPIRRVGIDIVDTNVDEFRNFMRNQDHLLYGVAALPFNQQDIQKKLANDMQNQMNSSGRFWNLSLTNFISILPNQKQDNTNLSDKVTALENKLTTDYNLDAWLKPSVIFSPDTTLVRLTLNTIDAQQKTLAREDILLEAQANEEKIKTAFAEALSRIISTIGHDGHVTYMRDNLITIDFGKERGLTRGQKIIAGSVLLKSFHPKSGEFLRSERIPLYQLKVLEAQKGSSLCEITDVDKIKLDEVTQVAGPQPLVLLAWRADSEPKTKGWHEPYDPQTAPLLGAVDSGFGVPVAKKEIPSPPKINRELLEKQTRNTTKNQQQVAVNSDAFEHENQQPQKVNYKNPHFRKKAKWQDPSTWNLIDYKISLGVSLGNIADVGATSFPDTLINQLGTFGFLQVDSKLDLYLQPYAQYGFFNGTTLFGNSYYLGALLYEAAWSSKTLRENLYIGADLQYTGGLIATDKRDYDLTNAQIGLNVKWESVLPTIGYYSLRGGFSIFDLIQRRPTWDFDVEFQPSEYITKELVFDLGMKRYINNWIEFSVGVSWNFLTE